MEVVLRLHEEQVKFFMEMNASHDTSDDESGVGVLPLDSEEGRVDRAVGLPSVGVALEYVKAGHPFMGWTRKSCWFLRRDLKSDGCWVLKLGGTRHSIRHNWLPHHWIHAERWPGKLEEYKKYEVIKCTSSQPEWLWWEIRDEAVARLARELFEKFARATITSASEGVASCIATLRINWPRRGDDPRWRELLESQFTRAGELAPTESPQGEITQRYPGQAEEYRRWAHRVNEVAPAELCLALMGPKLRPIFEAYMDTIHS